ncbi:MAG: hypothetical protein K2L23_00695 [Odoribacter sp.]|nr:hypothetical protein [Odoribacter sp.]
MKKLLFACVVIYLTGNVQAENPDAGQVRLPSEHRCVSPAYADTVGIIDLLRNVNRQKPTTEEQKQLTEKIDGNLQQSLFLYHLQDSVTEQPPFPEILTLIGESGIPVRAMTKHNLKLTIFFQKKDLQGAIGAAKHIARTDLSDMAMQDWFVFGKFVN